MPTEIAEQENAFAAALQFMRRNALLVLGTSALAIVPCVWHRHIEAGDLGSHVYNAWLAQLIGKGQAPGLYLATQWNNVLFDFALLHVANGLGFAAAEKIVVSASVLIFFWGVFALAAAVGGRAPWLLTPCIAMLAYGYSFNMGFFNYYLSIGLGCFCLAVVWPVAWPVPWPVAWKGGAAHWGIALVLAALTWLAHPIGFLWMAATIAYLAIRRGLPGKWKLVLPAGAVALLAGLRWYLHRRADLSLDWQSGLPFWQSNGADQLMVYGDRYATLAWAAVIFGAICLLAEAIPKRRELGWWKAVALPAEFYFVVFVTIAALPENLRVAMYPAWIGLLVSRLTAIAAIWGLCLLALARLRTWGFAGFAGLAAAYFLFLYQDTTTLNRMESNAERVLAAVPWGTRVIPTIVADPDWRVEFVGHLADRACVGRCFVYSNYEPSSRQFRVRVAQGGSWIVSNSAEDADDMQGGGYEIQKGDLPVKQLYQCDRGDWTKLCLRDLAEGESTGKARMRPGG